jgi:hypothetical protein
MLVTGFITYRTLARAADAPRVSDIAAVLAAVGGGAVTALFQKGDSDAFGWYSIGLAGGMAVYFSLFLLLNGKARTAKVLGADDPRPR